MCYFLNKDKRYITSGVNANLPIEIQILIWKCIDDLVESETKADYLQVFKFNYEPNGTLIMEHSQEMPKYSKKYSLEAKEEYNFLGGVKVYGICDITHSTLLLAQEY